jgi:hypothetical protein
LSKLLTTIKTLDRATVKDPAPTALLTGIL